MSAERRLALATFGYRGGVGGEVTKEVYKYVEDSIVTSVELPQISIDTSTSTYSVEVVETTRTVQIDVPSLNIDVIQLDI